MVWYIQLYRNRLIPFRKTDCLWKPPHNRICYFSDNIQRKGGRGAEPIQISWDRSASQTKTLPPDVKKTGQGVLGYMDIVWIQANLVKEWLSILPWLSCTHCYRLHFFSDHWILSLVLVWLIGRIRIRITSPFPHSPYIEQTPMWSCIYIFFK